MNIINDNKNNDILVRFEVDRAVTPDVIFKKSAIQDEYTLQNIVNKDGRNRNKIFLLPDSLYHVDGNGKINKLSSNESEKQALIEIFECLKDGNVMVVIDDEFLQDNDPEPNIRAMYELNKISKNQMAAVEYSWCGNHSFTLFIPKAIENEKRTFYPYQAFAYRHTLQQWFAGEKYNILSTAGIESYIATLTTLGTTKDKKTIHTLEASLFTLGGKDEQSVLNNPLAVIPWAMKIKFKVTEVNSTAANNNLNNLQNFINTYTGNNAKERVDSYKKEANEAMRKKLTSVLEPDNDYRRTQP